MTTNTAIQLLVEVCRRQHKSLSTERTYALWLKDYCAFIGRRDPALPGERKLESFLTMLARQRNVSASTQNQAFNAILFETTIGYCHAEALSVKSPLGA